MVYKAVKIRTHLYGLENAVFDPRIQKLARLLVNYSVCVQPNNKVLIRGSVASLPLVKEVYREALRAGGHPYVIWEEDSFAEIMLREGNEDQIKYMPEPIKDLFLTYDCIIGIRGSQNTRTLNNIHPDKQRLMQYGRNELMARFMQLAAEGKLRWVGTLYPTQAYAQEADMSLSEFTDFVFQSCHADKDDPITEWRKLSQMQQKLVDWLAGKKMIKVKGPHADLQLSIENRTFVNSDGRRNMPSGEIFTGPVEESVNGWVRFTYPAIHHGREVSGIELRFKDGKVIDASAQKNEAYLLNLLDTDPGARYLGEFAIGTNNGINRFTKSILFDEKIGGTIHMAVGRGYPETGSKNESAIHWDMICDMRNGGRIWVDDELFYDSGKFLILN